MHPQPSRRQRVAPLIELRIQKWWEVLVTLQSSLPTFVCDTGFTDRQPDHFPEMVAGVGVAPTEAELMRLA